VSWKYEDETGCGGCGGNQPLTKSARKALKPVRKCSGKGAGRSIILKPTEKSDHLLLHQSGRPAQIQKYSRTYFLEMGRRNGSFIYQQDAYNRGFLRSNLLNDCKKLM